MSVYFNSANNLSGDITDCLYSDNTGIKHSISSIWGNKDNSVVKLWGKDEEKIDDPYAVAPVDAYTEWNYTLNEDENTITLNSFIGNVNSSENVIVYSSYEVRNKKYRTKIANNTTNSGNYYMFASAGSKIVTVTFGNQIDFSTVKSMSYMFSACYNLTNINFGNNFNTSNITNMCSMFSGCSKLTSINFGDNFDTSNVTIMNGMFMDCQSLTIVDLSHFDTRNIKHMGGMFRNCKALTIIYVSESIWKEPTEYYKKDMFTNCGTNTVTYK